MDRVDQFTMDDDFWYEQPHTMHAPASPNTDIGRHNMHNMMEQTMDVMPRAKAKLNLRKILPLLPYIAVFVLALMVWQIGAGPQWFPIRNVKVEASYQQISRAEIKEMVTPFVTDGFFHFHSYALKEQLLANSWVAQAHVARRWPDGVAVVIKEHQPMVRWQNTGLISQQNKLFFPAHYQANQWYHLPHLSGPEELWRDVVDLYQQLRASAQQSATNVNIRALQVSDRQSWTVKVNQGTAVKLGRENMVARFEQFLQAYQQMPERERQRAATVDMRYPNGMAVRE